MSHGRRLAVHEAGSALHFAAIDGSEALMAQANTQDGNLARESIGWLRWKCRHLRGSQVRERQQDGRD